MNETTSFLFILTPEFIRLSKPKKQVCVTCDVSHSFVGKCE